LPIGQLPLVVVCEVAVCDDDVSAEVDADVSVDAVVDVVVDVVAEDDDEVSPDPDVPVLALVDARFVLAAAVWVVVALCPSRQAMTPPSKSIAATLRAAAALRARAARGLRRGRWERGVVGVCSSMSATLRMPHERPARSG
jgi:hypothetical protein